LAHSVGLGPGHIALDEDPAALPQGHSPQFSAHICCGQMAGWIKMPLGMEVGLGPGHIVLDGDPASPKKGTAPLPQFLAHVYCGQTAGWINMPLGTEADLGPGDIMLHGDPAPAKKGHSPQIFDPYLLWPNDFCMYHDTSWYGSQPQPGQHCVRWGSSSPSPEGAQPPNF